MVNASFQGREQIDQIFHDLCWSDPVTLFLRRSEWKGLRLHHVCNNSTEHYHSTTPEDLFVLYISKMISLDHFSDVCITKPLFWRNRKSNCDSQWVAYNDDDDLLPDQQTSPEKKFAYSTDKLQIQRRFGVVLDEATKQKGGPRQFTWIWRKAKKVVRVVCLLVNAPIRRRFYG